MFAEAASPFGRLVGFMVSAIPRFASRPYAGRGSIARRTLSKGFVTSCKCQYFRSGAARLLSRAALPFILLTAKPSPLSTPAPRTPQREAMLRLRRRIHRAAAAGPKCHSASRVPAPGDEFDAETDAAEACPSAHAEYVCHDAPQRRAPDHAGPGIPQRRSSAYPHLL